MILGAIVSDIIKCILNRRMLSTHQHHHTDVLKNIYYFYKTASAMPSLNKALAELKKQQQITAT